MLTGEVEPEPSGAGEITGDVSLAEQLAGLAVLSQIGDGCERGVDECVVDLGESA